MIIEKTCKECGGRVTGVQLLVYPPITQEKCEKCGRIVSSKQEKIKKIVV